MSRTLLAAIFALALCRCGGGESSSDQSSKASGAGPGAVPAGSDGAGSGGLAGSTPGTPSAGNGSAITGGAGGSPPMSAGASGGSNDAGSAGTSAGGAAGGANAAGTSGVADAGQAGGDGAATACTRELLSRTISAYFTALAAHDPATLPLADAVKFTENGAVMKLGERGLWTNAGALKYAQSALDVEACSSATHAVVPDGSTDIPLALRLKLEDQKITEIETIAVRAGDYRLGGQSLASNTGAIIAADGSVMWEEPVPAAERNSRAELTAWIDKYFRMFPRGVCNTVDSCRRLENGFGMFDCNAGASCASGAPSGNPALAPRILLADPERGIGVGMTMFMGNTDMHMFKMRGGRVHAVHAVLGGAASSGWD